MCGCVHKWVQPGVTVESSKKQENTHIAAGQVVLAPATAAQAGLQLLSTCKWAKLSQIKADRPTSSCRARPQYDDHQDWLCQMSMEHMQ